MKATFYQNAFYLLVGLIIGFIIATVIFYTPVQTNVQIQTQPIEKVRTFDNDSCPPPLSDATLMKELIKNNVQFPEIVLAQAKLETGYYTSKACREYNNLFGLRNKNGYYKFDDWRQSVIAYRDYVQYKYTGGDYFAFLDRIGYAEEPNYNTYVRRLMI